MRQLLKANLGLLAAGLGTFIVMGAGQSMFGPSLPALARIFGLAGPEAGLLVSAQWVGAAVGVAVMFLRPGWISPRVALVLMAAGAALMAAGLAWGLVLLGALVFGVGYGASTVVYNPLFLKRFGARGPAMVGLLNATFGIGAITAPLVFVALGNDPGMGFALVAGLCLLVWLAAGSVGAAPMTALAAGPFRLRPGILTFGAVAIGLEACLIGLGPTALIAAGETEAAAAQYLSLFFVAFLAVRVGLMWLSDLMPPFSLFTCALGLAGVAALGAVLLHPGLFFVLLGVAGGLFFPAFYVCATLRMGDDPRVAPTIIAAGLVGGISSPLILSGLMGWLGGQAFFWVVAGVALTAAAAGLLALGHMNRISGAAPAP